jgi:signal transduction histidine kinase/DNA-binding response OmpR family regulator
LVRNGKNPAVQSVAWLAVDGAMSARIHAFDWTKTTLGPVETWSPALRATLGVMLANRFPLLLWWGPDYISIYNDAYVPILGNKHPSALGLPVRECWSEIWDILKPLIDTPYNGGPSTWIEDFELHIQRLGHPEETHFTVAYSPVPDETTAQGIGGVLATVHEITQKVIAERRVAILRDLGVRAAEGSAEETCRAAAEILTHHVKDVPFALLFLVDADGQHARLAAAAGVEPGKDVSPLVVRLDQIETENTWPLSAVNSHQNMVTVTDLKSRFKVIPPGPWADPPHTAVVVPIRSNKANELAGFLVSGVSAHLTLDEQYRGFYELMASQIATAIAQARAYEEERKRAEALAEIDRAKTAFFSNVSHEFRTPLTLMLGPLEDLKQESTRLQSPLSASQHQQLDLIHRNSLRLLKLTNALLDFARIEAGRVQAVYEPTDLAAFTTELASVFRSAVEKTGLKLVVNCPPLTEPAFVDRDMWEKIVLNLISNAFKFTFNGEIEVSLRQTDTQIELAVRDTGTGIAVDELPKLFERFYRVAGAQGRTHEGSGIGLALVQELARLHGGSVSVESHYGQGSTFKVAIPLGRNHLPAQSIGAERTQASTALGARPFVEEALRWLPVSSSRNEVGIDDFDMSKHTARQDGERSRILVADDNSDMRDYLRQLLGARYEVETVADGEAALAAIDKRAPDLVLTDIMMPRLDGLGLLARLRADPHTKTLPVILLSARAGEEARIEGLHTGADDYLIKPFSARELVARIRSAIQMARVRHEAEQMQQLLVNELNHRVKNTLASVQAIVQHTLRSTKNPTDFAASFSGRIQSMAKVHSLLSNTSWKGADLRDVIRDQLKFGPMDETRLTAWGPPVSLGPQTTQHLALMVHELGTNSSKYGALSTPRGWVTINWTVEDSMLRFKWMEQGGPPVRAPIKRGFGTTLIEQSAHVEGGRARMSIETGGVVWEIEFPLPELDASATSEPASSAHLIDSEINEAALKRLDQRPLVLAGRRFLVIEDEPLVALDIVAGLEESGAEIVGSAGTVEEAVQLIDSTSMDAVLLDGNLRGRPVDDLAAALTRKKVPFVFVTGYGQKSLPRSFGHAPMLAKPFSREQLLEAVLPLVEPPTATFQLRPRIPKS